MGTLLILKAIFDVLNSMTGSVINVIKISKYLDNGDSKPVLQEWKLTPEEAEKLVRGGGFLTDEGIKKALELSGKLLPGEWVCRCLYILGQPQKGGYEKIRVTYIFTNISLILFEDKPHARGAADYDPYRWRYPLSSITAATIRIWKDTSISPIDDSRDGYEYAWHYDDDVYPDPKELIALIVANKMHCYKPAP